MEETRVDIFLKKSVPIIVGAGIGAAVIALVPAVYMIYSLSFLVIGFITGYLLGLADGE